MNEFAAEVSKHWGEILAGFGVGLLLIWRLVAPAIGRYFTAKLDARTETVRQQFEAHKAEVEIQRRNEQLRYEAQIAEIKSRTDNWDTIIQTQEKLVNSIVDMAKEQSVNNRVVSANTTALTGNTEALGNVVQAVQQVQADIATVKLEMAGIRELVEKRLPPADCIDVDEQLRKFEERMIEIIEKNNTAEIKAVVITDNVQPPAQENAA